MDYFIITVYGIIITDVYAGVSTCLFFYIYYLRI